jgi:hypothetical protein
MMDGIGKMDVAWTPRNQVSHVMQYPLRLAMPIGAMSAVWTRLTSEIPATFDDLRFGQILRPFDAFRDIRQVLSRSWHGIALLGNALQARNLPTMCRRVTIKTQ